MVANDTIHIWRQKNNVVVMKCERALKPYSLKLQRCETGDSMACMHEIFVS